jgi:enoyl-CoA hydratase/3-hydroxyacyl-CoA dehydrogenase
VRVLAGRTRHVAEGAAPLPPFDAVVPKAADGMPLSATAIALMESAIREAAAAPTLAAALEIGYRAFGRSACTAAAREGIAAFAEHRRPDFERTG